MPVLPLQKEASKITPQLPTLPLPTGFRASGLRAGIGKDPRKPDLALFFSEVPCCAAGVFTTNRVAAAPVLWSRSVIRSGRAQAILANSGCANACTGPRGFRDARRMARSVARALALSEREVLIASTGVIGQFLPIESIEKAIPLLAARTLNPEKGFSASVLRAVQGIMTTDTVPKYASRSVRLGKKRYTIWGCAKGAGMIHPKMATMFSFLFTDADLPLGAMRSQIRHVTDRTFNSLSVDGDTSTNDCVFFLANGLSGCQLRSAGELNRFSRELFAVADELALRMAQDGEGATKRIEITVSGARSDGDARKVAETVATSPLVKTAVFGRDANWGRVIAAVGRAGVPLHPARIRIAFGGLTVALGGCAAHFSESRARKILGGAVVPIAVDLGMGRGRALYRTCDFSFDYVKINAEYRT